MQESSFHFYKEKSNKIKKKPEFSLLNSLHFLAKKFQILIFRLFFYKCYGDRGIDKLRKFEKYLIDFILHK